MWKKILWAILIIYIIGTVVLAVIPITEGEPVTTLFPGILIMLIPAGILYLDIREWKSPNIFVSILLAIGYLLSLLFLAVAVAGNFNFNDLNIWTILKGLFLVPMLIALLYFAFRRVFKKNS